MVGWKVELGRVAAQWKKPNAGFASEGELNCRRRC